MKQLTLTALLCLSAASMAKPVDLSSYSIFGVKEGQKAEQAAAAFQEACQSLPEKRVYLNAEKTEEFLDPDGKNKARYQKAQLPVTEALSCLWQSNDAKGLATLETVDGQLFIIETMQFEPDAATTENAARILNDAIAKNGKPVAQLLPKDGVSYYLEDGDREFYGLDSQEENDKYTYLGAACWGDCSIKDGNRLITNAKDYWIAVYAQDGELVIRSTLGNAEHFIQLAKKLRGNESPAAH